MASSQLNELLRDLPSRLRDQVTTYVDFVEDAAEEILLDVAPELQEPSPELMQSFVFAAAVWRLWSIVAAQPAIVEGSLELLAASDVSAVRVGGSVYTRASADYVALVELRAGMAQALSRRGAGFIITADSLRELARATINDYGR